MIRVNRVRDGTRQLERILRGFRGASKVKVGFPEGTDSTQGGILDRAVFNEFGTRDIPERPFMRNGLRDGVPQLRHTARVVARKVIHGRITPRQALGQMGENGKQLIQDSITDMRDPPNAAKTIERKGSSNPLIDSGDMHKAVKWEIE